MRKNIFFLIFGSIVLLGFLLRVVYLDRYPAAVSWDEVSHGYNAYSILTTGADEWGNKFPIFNFRAYGDYPLPLNLYITSPSVAAFGLNEFSIRLPHAILGVLTVIATYFLGMGISKRKSLSLLAAFLVAIEPWTFFTSRIVLQQNLSVFLLTAAMAAFFNRQKNKYLLPISFLFLFLTLFSYHSTRIFSPLILAAGVVVYRGEFLRVLKKGGYKSFFAVLTVVSFFVLSGLIVLAPSARARAQWLFIINQGAINKIEEQRQNSKLPPTLSRLIYNRPVYFVSRFSQNYFGYLSPRFLFLSGGTQYQYSLPSKGLSYLINLPFFYLGVLILLKRAFKGSKDHLFLLAWLLLSPVPGSITSEVYAVTRASVMIPLPQILSAIGAFLVFDYLNKRFRNKFKVLLTALYFVAIYLFAENYLMDYFTDYTTKYSSSWQYGYKQVVEYAKDNYAKYDKIIVSKKYGEPHEFFLFFWPWDPAKYKSDPNLIRFAQSDWFWVDRFDKFYFVNDWDIPKSGTSFVLESKGKVDCSKSACLLVTSPENKPSGWQKLETINFLDGRGAFEIYEN